ncbi:MAG: hypothetical protein AAF433_20360 [Bacteroidota bacterium]
MMKYVLVALCCTLSVLGLQAQRLSTPELYPSRSELVAQYQLDEVQQLELNRIIDQREANLESLGQFTNQDAETYWTKRRSIYYGELTSIRLILEGPEQLAAFDEQRVADRIAESERVRELMEQGHGRSAAKILMLERY